MTALLDWHDSTHFNYRGSAPCRYCGHGCLLLDDDGQPAHKACAETHLDPALITRLNDRTPHRRQRRH